MSAVATLAMTPQQPGGGSSRDATLARQLAGATFRRADTLRDERGIDRDHVVERFLRNVQGHTDGRTRLRNRLLADAYGGEANVAVVNRYNTGWGGEGAVPGTAAGAGAQGWQGTTRARVGPSPVVPS